MSSSRLANTKKAFDFLLEFDGQEIRLQDLASSSGWALHTVKTYKTKKLNGILIKSSDNKFKVVGISKYTFEEFQKLLSQKDSSESLNRGAFPPFSNENLQLILKKNSQNKTKLKTCESFEIEYKESYNWANKSQYAKTMAAYANTKGGYLIFGVTDAQKEIKGLSSSNAFLELQVHRVSEYLNSKFSPELRWHHEIYFDKDVEVNIGLLYVEESQHKPVVSVGDDMPYIKEAEIYYRYPGRSEKIKYPELVKIIEDEKLKERKLWINNIEKMSQIGISQVSILDNSTGEISNPKGSLLIDEKLLSKINFIQEGNFSEIDGDPTLRVIGDVTPIYGAAVRQVYTPTAINETTIIEAFLEQANIVDPMLYIKELCNQSTWYLPIYYYMCLAKLDIKTTIEEIQKLDYKKYTQIQLISRLENDCRLVICGNALEMEPLKTNFIEMIRANNLPEELPLDEFKVFCQVITILQKDDLNWDYLRKKLSSYRKDALKNGLTSTDKTNSRKAICYLDKLLYG